MRLLPLVAEAVTGGRGVEVAVGVVRAVLGLVVAPVAALGVTGAQLLARRRRGHGAEEVVRQAVTLTSPATGGRDGGGGAGQHGCQEQDEKGGSSGRHCADFTVGCKEEKKQLSRLFDIVCQDVARRYAVPICVV